MSGRLGVGFVQQRLDTEKNLLDSDGGLPAFFFIENGQADSAGRIDVGVEERRNKLAWWESDGTEEDEEVEKEGHTLGRLGRVLVRELDLELEEATLPQSLFLARDGALPLLKIETALGVLCGLCDEAEGVILAPLLSLFRETVGTERHGSGADVLDQEVVVCLELEGRSMLLQRWEQSDVPGKVATKQSRCCCVVEAVQSCVST